MMNYEIFKEVFKEKLLDYMPDEFKEHRVVEHKVFKVNCEKDAINLLSGMARVNIKVHQLFMWVNFMRCTRIEKTWIM